MRLKSQPQRMRSRNRIPESGFITLLVLGLTSQISEIVHKENIKKTESANSNFPIGLIMWIFVVIFFLIGILIF